MNPPRLLEVRDLVKHFPIRKGLMQRTVGQVRAVDGVSFSLGVGETLGLVGESGCGKSTLARLVLRLIPASSGSIRLSGRELSPLDDDAMRPLRRDMQVVFQDPFSALNPRHKVEEILTEPLVNYGLGTPSERRAKAAALLARVGLPPDALGRYPHEFSGGQRQRLGIARALVLEPRLIVCDEAVSALDVSIQAQILNLLDDLQRERGLAYLFIAHDLGVVEHVSHRVAVMYLGRIVETASREDLFGDPRHPYTEALLAAVPRPRPERGAMRRRGVLSGDVPSPSRIPTGCRFRTRCPLADDRCAAEEPVLRESRPGHLIACHHR